MSSSSGTLLSSLSPWTANKATSGPSSSSSLALSALGCPRPSRCGTLFCATGCCRPGLAACFGFLGAGLAMGAPCLGGGGGAGFATGFPGLGFGLGLGGRVICITVWISTLSCPAIVEGGTVCCRTVSRSSLGGVFTKQGPNIFVEDSEKKATWWNCRKRSGKTKVIYTTQHNCFYNSKRWGLPLHNGQGCNTHTKNKRSQIGPIPHHTLLRQ